MGSEGRKPIGNIWGKARWVERYAGNRGESAKEKETLQELPSWRQLR